MFSHQQFKQILNHYPQAVRVIGLDFHHLFANQRYRDWLGCTVETNLETQTCFDWLPSARCHTPQCPVTSILQGAESSSCRVFRSMPDGKKKFLSCHAVPLKDENNKIVAVVEYMEDATEQNQVASKLERREKEFQTLFETAPFGFFRAHADGTLLDANPALADLLGYAAVDELIESVNENDPEQPFAVFPSKWKKSLYQVSDSIGWHRFEGHFYSKQKRVIFADLTMRMAQSEDGVFKHYECYVENITGRKQVELLYPVILDRASDLIFLTDHEGIVTYFNRSVEKLFDLNTSSFNRIQLPFFFHGESVAVVQNLLDTVQEEQIPLSADCFSQGVHYEINLTPIIQNDSVVSHVCMARDITHRKKAEDALLDSEQRLSDIISFLPDPTFVVDHDRRVVAWNRAIEKLTKVREEDMLGKGKYEYALPFYGERRPTLIDLAMSSDPNVEQQYDSVRKDGETLTAEKFTSRLSPSGGYFRMTARPFYNTQGQILGAIESIRDITKQRRAEEKLQEKAQQLARSNDELKQFAYVASHDLQEPLRTITSYVQLIARRNVGHFDNDSKEFMDFVLSGTARMQQMIQDLLTYSRLTTRSHTFLPVDLNTLILEVRENLSKAIQETQAQISTDSLPTISGDASQLLRLFQNLLSNAIKFRGDTPPHIHIACQEHDTNFSVSIQDNGIGFDPEFSERIFLMFQRLHPQHTYSGTGIGLALCKKIMERHGGEIRAESNPGKGSTFILTFSSSD